MIEDDAVGTARASSAGGPTYVVLRPSPVTIDPNRILRLQGYRDLTKVRPIIQAIAERVSAQASEVIAPEIYYRRLCIEEVSGGRLKLRGGIAFENRAFDRFLERAVEVIVFVLTMGRALDEVVTDELKNDHLIEALFLEMAGWLGVEWATKQLARHLSAWASGEGFRVTTRLGPGYRYKLRGQQVDWPLLQQERLFALFDDVPLPVTLLDSCVMVPKMSRSGLYGLIRAAP